MLNYNDAIALSKRAKDKTIGKKIANNTYIRVESDIVKVRLHSTDIISIDNNNVYTLDTGGWNTLTTRERLNKYTPFRIYVNKKVAYIYTGDNSPWTDKKPGVSVELFDGIQVNSAGTVLNPRPVSEEKRINDNRKKLDKAITKYINGFCALIRDGGLEYPTGGDCWYCAMTTDEGIPLGDSTKNYEHIFSHFEEGYFVPSLLFSAIKSKNYGNPEIIFEMIKSGKSSGAQIARCELRYYFRKHYESLLASM